MVIRVYDDGGDYAGPSALLSVWSTLNPTFRYPLRIEAALGESPIIDATGNLYGIYAPIGPSHIRVKGIEVHSATTHGIYSRQQIIYLEDVYLHDMASDAGSHIGFITGSRAYACNSRFEGVGRVFIQSTSVNFNRCSFSGGDVDTYMILHYNMAPKDTVSYLACKFDGSSLDAGKPIILLNGTADAGRHGLLDVRNCIVYDGGYFVSQNTANFENPPYLRAFNSIFVDQDTGVFDISGNYTEINEGKAYLLEANCFWNCGDYLIDNNGTYTSLAELQAAGYDTLQRSITSDPKLTTPFDGTIGSDSPCIETGIGAGVLLDLNGVSFSQIYSLPSIGCDAQWDTDIAPFVPDTPILESVTPTSQQLVLHFDIADGVRVYGFATPEGGSRPAATFSALGAGGAGADVTITSLANFKHYLCDGVVKNGVYWSTPSDYQVGVPTDGTGHWETMCNAIKGRFKAHVADALSITALYDNDPTSKPADGTQFARCTVIPGEDAQASIGATDNRYRTMGVMIASIFIPIAKGSEPAYSVADTIRSAFKSVTVGGVTFRTPSIARVGRTTEGKYWQVNVTCPFYSDEN